MTADAAVIEFLGLDQIAVSTTTAAFPLGILYPYSRDLQKVCSSYSAAIAQWPAAEDALVGGRFSGGVPPTEEQVAAARSYVEAIASLYHRIVFAPGEAGTNVAEAHRQVSGFLASAIPARSSGSVRS